MTDQPTSDESRGFPSGQSSDMESSTFTPPAYIAAAHAANPNWSMATGQRNVFIVASVIVCLVACCVGARIVSAGSTGSGNSPTAGQAQAATDTTGPTATFGPSPTPAPTSTPTSTPTPAPTATPTLPAFQDGTFQVGKDIQPGTYRTREASPGCYYARLKGFSGALGDIIANNNTDDPAIVTIAPSDAGFESTRCGTWTKDLSQITQSRTTFADGMYIVGTDIEPGTYRNTASPGCYYARLSGFGNTLSDIIANNNVDTATIVTIAASDKGFESTRCGTWVKQ